MKIKVRVPHYYDTFHCTGSRCPDTCCIGWMIEIDEPSYQRFMKMKGEFGERIRRNITERPDGHFFALNENGRCAFLNEDHLCEMVIKLGEESLCSLCDNYPRVGEEFGALREMGLSFSCPEVAKLILSSKKPIRFGEWYQEEEIEGPDYTRDVLFNALLDLRDVVFGILQDREMSVKNRAALYLMIASRLQNVIDREDESGAPAMVSKIREIIKDYSGDSYRTRMVQAIQTADAETSRKNLLQMFQFVENLESINEKWTDLFATATAFMKNGSVKQWEEQNREFALSDQENDYAYEHLMVYYVYRYFLKMVLDGDIYSKAVLCVLALLVIREMNVAFWCLNKNVNKLENQITMMYLYSKEIEHCEENIERLTDEFWKNDLYQPKNLIDTMTKIL